MDGTHRCKVAWKYLCRIILPGKYMRHSFDEVNADVLRETFSIVKGGFVVALVPALNLVPISKINVPI